MIVIQGIKPKEPEKTDTRFTGSSSRRKIFAALGGAALLGVVGLTKHMSTDSNPETVYKDVTEGIIAPDKRIEPFNTLKEGDKILINGEVYTYKWVDSPFFPNYVHVEERDEPFEYKGNKFKSTK